MKRIDTSHCDEYMAIIEQTGGHFEVRRWSAKAPVKAIVTNKGTPDEHRFRVQKEKAFLLKGWYPWTRIRFFQSILDALSHWVHSVGLLLYDENREPDEDGYILPLDRINETVTNPNPTDILSPDVHQVIGESKIYTEAMRKLHFGGGMSWKTGTIVLGAMLFLMLILYMGGYFD